PISSDKRPPPAASTEGVARAAPCPEAALQLMTRAEVARALNVHKSSVRRYEKKGLLNARKIDGEYFFDRVEVTHVLTTRSAKAQQAIDDGAIAARAFRMFDEGKDLRAVVGELGLEPARVHALYDEWSQPDLAQRALAREIDAEVADETKEKRDARAEAL